MADSHWGNSNWVEPVQRWREARCSLRVPRLSIGLPIASVLACDAFTLNLSNAGTCSAPTRSRPVNQFALDVYEHLQHEEGKPVFFTAEYFGGTFDGLRGRRRSDGS